MIKPCEICGQPMECQRSTKKTCSTACRAAMSRLRNGPNRPPLRTIPEGHTWCSKCEEIKPLTEFYTSKSGRVFSYCKPCKRTHQNAWKRRSRGLPEDAVLVPGMAPKPLGSVRYDSAGYVLEKVGEDGTAHHRADKNGWVYQHILVAERKYKMTITRDHTVHHRNGLRDDNRPDNLELRAGPHGKGADILPHALRTREGRAIAQAILENYGYTVTPPE